MSDKVKNWYDHLNNKLKRETKLDKNFKKHHILPNSMICCIGGTGSGKTNALVDWLSRKNDAFYHIIILQVQQVMNHYIRCLNKRCQILNYIMI